jgi:hypothetical protein
MEMIMTRPSEHEPEQCPGSEVAFFPSPDHWWTKHSKSLLAISPPYGDDSPVVVCIFVNPTIQQHPAGCCRFRKAGSLKMYTDENWSTFMANCCRAGDNPETKTAQRMAAAQQNRILRK